MKNKKDITDFYDDFSEHQKQMLHNERHYFLLKQMQKNGLQSNSSILEIGCGIGSMSNLIAPKIKKGKLVAIDISPKSIEIAKNNNSHYSNVSFFVIDSTQQIIPKNNYNLIILFDVLEHIPTEERDEMLKQISILMDNNAVFLVNVPAPNAHIDSIKTQPHLMQVIENPVFIHDFAQLLNKNGMAIKSFFTYDMWQKEEYQFYVIHKEQPYVYQKTFPSSSLNPYSIKKRILRKIDSLKNFKNK